MRESRLGLGPLTVPSSDVNTSSQNHTSESESLGISCVSCFVGLVSLAKWEVLCD